MTTETPASTTAAATASTPTRLMELFSQRVHDRDLDALMELYERDAVFLPSSGGILTGRDAIRGGLAELLALEPVMNVRVAQVLSTGDTALVVNDWSMTGMAPGGSAVREGGTSADLLRRQPDGSWLVLIDHP